MRPSRVIRMLSGFRSRWRIPAACAAASPQRFVADYVYELPFGHGKQFPSHGLASWILGNWQNSGIVSFQTGTPISISAACTFSGASGLGCFRERMRLQFRAEMYNILNHPNLDAPSPSITSSTYGQITSKGGNRRVTMALRLEV